MRPIRLEIKGFTSFREKTEVDFQGLGLFAITGQTGAGKTSILDAMTWALYGRTPRLRNNKDLISQGAKSLSVELQFRVGQEDHRVVRQLSGAAAAKVRLERLDHGEWLPVTGNVTELNERVRALVGLDFDSFNKAVILPQGEFDKFLRGKAEERRSVLTDLLDVGVYQRMMQSANEKSRRQNEQADFKRNEIDNSVSPEAIDALAAQLAIAVAEVSTLAEALKKLDGVFADAVALSETRKREASLAAARRELQDQLDALPGTEGEYDAAEHLRLKDLLPRVEGRVRMEKAIAEAAKNLTAARVRKASATEVWEQARQILDEAAWTRAEDRFRADLVHVQQEAQSAKEHYDHLHALDRVTAFRTELESGHACPVCEQTVTTVPPVVDATALEAARKANLQQAATLKGAEVALEKARHKAEQDRKAADLEERRTRDDLAKAQQEVATQDSARQTLEEQLALLNVDDSVSLDDVRRRLRELDVLVKTDDLRKQSAGKSAEIEAARKESEVKATRIRAQFPEASPSSEAAWISERRRGTQQQIDAHRQRIAHGEAEIQRLNEKLARNQKLRGEIEIHLREAAEFKELGTFLNAGNFQQFLLDSALERLATEGSKHLAILSANRYQFAWQNKEFFVKDSWHGDEERPVATLSGGESFLASLSLALALAEGIAQLNSESGRVVLESLFLDEGFSTLDSETLGTVADALMMLQSGERLIGIITHVPGLADQMPGRIDVEKTVAGSRVHQSGANGMAVGAS